MLQQLIKLGEFTEEIFFKEPIPLDAVVIIMHIDINEKDKFYVKKVTSTKEKSDKNLMLYIQPTKLLTQGMVMHFLIADFKLSTSMLEGDPVNVLKDKINRNFDYAKKFYEQLDLESNELRFINNFHNLLLKDDSKFIEDVWNESNDILEGRSQSDIANNVFFAFKVSKNIISQYELKVLKNSKNDYFLGEILFFRKIYPKINANTNLKRIKGKNYQCSFCNEHKNFLYSPNRAGVYFSYTGTKENNYFDLQKNKPERHMIICDECYGNLKGGHRFMKNYLKNKFMGITFFATYNLENKNLDKEIIEILKKEKDIKNVFTNEQMQEKLDLIDDIDRALYNYGIVGNNQELTINLYFGYFDNGFRLIKLISDIFPSKLISFFEESRNFPHFYPSSFLRDLFSPFAGRRDYDLFVKKRIDLLERILLERRINYDSLLSATVKKMSYYLRNKENSDDYKAQNFTISFLKLIYLLAKLNSKLYSNKINLNFFNKNIKMVKNMNEKTKEYKGNTGVEKLQDFVQKNQFISENINIEAGIYLGILIRRLSYDINNYEKATLGYAEKKLNNVDSLKRFINDIQNKLILHEMGKQKMSKAFSEKVLEIFNKNSFSKNDFIFGMFLGYSLSNKFKKSKKKKNEE